MPPIPFGRGWQLRVVTAAPAGIEAAAQQFLDNGFEPFAVVGGITGNVVLFLRRNRQEGQRGQG